MAGESRAFWVWLFVLCVAASMMAVGLIVETIAVHNGPDGFFDAVTSEQTAPAAPPSGPSSHPVINITDDPGGSVMQYYRKYQALSDAGAEIHFHGLCASSCSIVLFKEFTGIRACADEGALFGFHKPFEEKEGKIIRTKSSIKGSRELWAMWLAELPDHLHRYLQSVHVPSAAEGDEPNTMLILPAKMLLPRCPVSVARND